MASPWPNEESKFRKRTSSVGLRLDVTTRIHDDDIVEEGRELFQNFLTDEIRREGLHEPAYLTPGPYPATTPSTATLRSPVSGLSSPSSEHYRYPMWARTGKELRRLADTFSQTNERHQVRERACRISLHEDFTYDHFKDLVSTLFSGGMTRERIVILFFFCSDMAILTLRQNMLDYFNRILMWSLRYISERVCSWVREHGGWEPVIRGSLPYLNCAAAIAIIATSLVIGWVYLRNRSSGQ
ncbi:apoptosis regulator BAX-like [Glandiceps talaboti]